MWHVRRFAPTLRRQRYHIEASVNFKGKSDEAGNVVGKGSCFGNSTPQLSNRSLPLKEYCYLKSICDKTYIRSRSICSQVTAINDEKNGFEEASSTIDAAPTGNPTVEQKGGVESLSELELEDASEDLDVVDNDHGLTGENFQKKTAISNLFETIVADQGKSVYGILAKWIEEGNSLDRPEVSLAMLNLRKCRMYGKALQLMEWLEANKQLEFTPRDYATCVDLIAKVNGIQKAENYIDKIPESSRTEVVYRTLLGNYVNRVNMKKAEQVFNKIRKLNLPITVFACNLMIIVYKRLDKKKVDDILLLMEEEKIMPSLFTYKLLIDIKGESNDIIGMEQLVMSMKSGGIEPDLETLSILAEHYVTGGLKSKAEAVLKNIEEEMLKGNQGAQRLLLSLYASLGNSDGVRRIWKVCQLNPKIDEFVAAIEAWGKLGEIEEAEAVFEKMLQTWENLPSRYYSALLYVYANNKLVAKGKELMIRMGNSGSWVCSLTWDAIVKLYVVAGELEEAHSALQKATQLNRVKPLYNSFMKVMEQYSKQGDVDNTEKVLSKMRHCGYRGRLKPYELLLQAYVNAKSPAYGFRERMKGDDVFPNRLFAATLAQADPFRRTSIQSLLD